jgi:rhamnose utilization protein RhaD (predicted bifunctional aldolase and dehydrogenase)/NAD(P)-dependent dehydrogenase (short-subunit alcohol dehydrogenase family)
MPGITSVQIDQLVAMSRRYGADPSFCLAGGGNTSVKSGDRLLVKASGVALGTIDPDGFVELDRHALAEIMEREFPADPTAREEQFKRATLAARTQPEMNQRPSVECILHHLFPRTFVAHTHATLVNTITCRRDGQALAQTLFGDDVLWLPYVDPGLVLAHTLDKHLRAWQERTDRDCPKAVFMANHGLIVAGESAAEIEQLTEKVIDTIRRHLETTSDEGVFGAGIKTGANAARRLINTIGPALRGLLAPGSDLKIVTFDDSPAVLDLVAGLRGREAALAGPLIPDQIVYCRSFPLWFEPLEGEEPGQMMARLREALAGHERGRRFRPNIVLVRGVGLFAAGNDFAAADTARNVYLDAIAIMAGAIRLGGVRALAEQEYRFIEDWEVEAYRQAVSISAVAAGRAAGKVALVTGAAQGFGFEISQDLIAQGAHVVLADVNAEGARLAAARLGPRAIGLAVNVTAGKSVEAAVHQAVRRFGGIDLLVSNAGVLKAGSVKTLAEEDFDAVTAVNYKGYFVCVQHVAPILAAQHLARPDIWTDIIQINSKSGLEGSNRNGAYAGSKFGGIGLTQSFALELVSDGIKVNSICPGNFFAGPLWSDPVNGLFVQYLRSGKVPGARTIGDVRQAYESKVPMGRGCTTADVMKAIYYLMEQKFETGQALPVTGGQVMLS